MPETKPCYLLERLRQAEAEREELTTELGQIKRLLDQSYLAYRMEGNTLVERVAWLVDEAEQACSELGSEYIS